MEQLKELVLVIARALVDEPDQVKVNVIQGDSILVFELSVAKNDVGKIIGKNGNTINAIRTVLQAAASSHKKRVKLEVVS